MRDVGDQLAAQPVVFFQLVDLRAYLLRHVDEGVGQGVDLVADGLGLLKIGRLREVRFGHALHLGAQSFQALGQQVKDEETDQRGQQNDTDSNRGACTKRVGTANVARQCFVGLAAEHDVEIALERIVEADFMRREHFVFVHIARVVTMQREACVTCDERLNRFEVDPRHEHRILGQVVAEDVALRVEQVDLGRRVDDHGVARQVPEAVEVRRAVRDQLPLVGDVHRDGRVQFLRQLFVIGAREVALREK